MAGRNGDILQNPEAGLRLTGEESGLELIRQIGETIPRGAGESLCFWTPEKKWNPPSPGMYEMSRGLKIQNPA